MHSVRVLKIINNSVLADPPIIESDCPRSAVAGEDVSLSATARSAAPALSWHWDFGDGVQADGPQVAHAWTESGDYEVRLKADGIDRPAEKICRVHITGHLNTVFTPSAKTRYQPN
jgi:PKD repeat protein